MTAASPPEDPWPGITAGDIFLDAGGGLVGLAIRAACLGSYAHTGCVVEPPDTDGYMASVEFYPGGGKLRRDRHKHRVHRVIRVWRTEHERQAIITEALSHVGRRYAYGELLRIALNQLRLPVPDIPDRPGTMICSNSVARAVMAARPDVALSWPPYMIWPNRLAEDLTQVAWRDHRAAERAAKRNR